MRTTLLCIAQGIVLSILFSSAQGESISKDDTVVVTAQGTPVNLGREVIAVVPKGTRMKVVEVAGAWVGVEVNTPNGIRKGWVKADAVQRVRDTGPARPAAPATSGAKAGDWPQWHGPNRDNLSLETGLLKQWPEGGPELLWTAREIGDGFASLAISDGRIYTAGNLGADMKITAIDMDGKTLWQNRCGPACTESYPGSRGTPTVVQGSIYYETPNGDVTCLEARSGKEVWSRNILRDFRGQNIGWGLSESVLVEGDLVVCCPGGPRAGVVALNRADGGTVWACEGLSDKPAWASPIVAEIGGRRQIVALSEGGVAGIDPKTGQALWQFRRNGVYIATPVVYQNQVFFSSGYGKGSTMVRLNVGQSGISVSEAWSSQDMDNHHGGVLLVDGHLYGSCHQFHRSGWVCLEFQTGRLTWSGNDIGKGTATCAEGLLYILDESGNMMLARPSPQGISVLSRFRLPRGGQGSIFSHPVICGGRLFVRHGGLLYAFNIKAR